MGFDFMLGGLGRQGWFAGCVQEGRADFVPNGGAKVVAWRLRLGWVSCARNPPHLEQAVASSEGSATGAAFGVTGAEEWK